MVSLTQEADEDDFEEDEEDDEDDDEEDEVFISIKTGIFKISFPSWPYHVSYCLIITISSVIPIVSL